ncbi:amidohydrolase family protein [Sandaracinobacter neustonicus]|uniref:Amidohydrolase family protein n=1 Tax=Sandaracinobacter neustonicus TaxID=1715348 RepID=A0A501XD27_9SPHN|nr:amidohydrolase family protein [Sandaracinobacter neustonicus]TPE58471.1 amidohydrolase family protein [Sandaracinobacter neustonicus]
MKRLLPALIAALLSAPALAEPATLYSGATIIDGTGAPARLNQDLLVSGERILAIGPRGSLNAGGATRVDVAGRTIIPGLVDSHVHLATPPNRQEAEAKLRRNLYGGVTMVRSMADDDRAVAELARAAREAEIPAPDIFFAAITAGPDFFADPRVAAASRGWKPGTAPWMQAIDDSTDLKQAMTLVRGTGATAIKIYADLPPHLVTALTAEAHKQGLMVWAHSAIFPTRPADGIEAGVDSVSHICYLAYQVEPNIHPSYEDRTPVDERLLKPDDPVMAGLFRRILAQHILVDATGSLFVREDASRKADPKANPLRCSGKAVIALTQQAVAMGVPISTGTDFTLPASEPWPEVHEELLFLARDVKMPPMAVIEAATRLGAVAAGQEKERGTLTPGKLADFVILRADPLADIANIRSVETVVKRGRAYPRAAYRGE